MKYGVIGCGVMGSAIAKALIEGAGAGQVMVTNRTPEKALAFTEKYGCLQGKNEQAAECEYVVLAVKPQMMKGVLSSLKPVLQKREQRAILVSMAAGLSISALRDFVGLDLPVIRIMPNTPSEIGLGVIPYCSEGVSEEQCRAFLRDVASAGKTDEIPENLMDAASCVAGCGPAWCFQMIEALADAGVACGLPRKKAQLYATGMMQGSAALCLQKEKHPGELKDMVCSPGGSTIQGVRVLEERGFRGAVIDAVLAAYAKTREMGKKE